MTHCLRVGVGGPVGSGKTALLKQLCTALRDHYDIAVVTNDIYTREDADFLLPRCAASGSHLGRRNWRLPAHGDSGRCLDEPSGD